MRYDLKLRLTIWGYTAALNQFCHKMDIHVSSLSPQNISIKLQIETIRFPKNSPKYLFQTLYTVIKLRILLLEELFRNRVISSRLKTFFSLSPRKDHCMFFFLPRQFPIQQGIPSIKLPGSGKKKRKNSAK